ncbi:MAG: hypothetical protein LIO68_00485 [Rikenellaceae bacterium]|nr:hypothetical protein [Rikenellaceae bacterium]
MKQSLLLFLLPFAVSVASAQLTPERGDKFLKRIENNYSSGDIYVEADGSRHGDYNFGSKGPVERLFFGDFNAPVEYFLDPSFEASREGAIGFRVYPDSAGRQILEVKYIPNYEEAYRQLEKEYPTIGIPAAEYFTTPEARRDSIAAHNRVMISKFYEELPKCFRIASKKIYIGDTLAIRLYDRIMQAVRDYASPGKPMRSTDGESVTFRCVVGHDLWTLAIQSPGGGMDKLSSLCKRIISDVRGGSLDENACLRQLGD